MAVVAATVTLQYLNVRHRIVSLQASCFLSPIPYSCTSISNQSVAMMYNHIMARLCDSKRGRPCDIMQHIVM